ncbi:deoxyribose-phosphate aldolase [Coraliomargarita akajimensis]|uniref:Deoxyribose-phosphate aldolase n=1 Tax=Coraliomargarita akajimensis (strain DSM 45221 / IAM 15411 / JCM 23193 / KCTC 12865 / 04OKA010-24) TaxID=583355 RepID=D5EHZ9_CORAD|nr:deoxyribose-phosphate aldolase [Coraliomargarita akajimensis]ADE56039.1 deoxyribose-phosphate aldolase [Coraliomargarita akajimensis DSM 45221]
MHPDKLARYLDATNLKLDSTDGELCALCDEAAQANYASVCVYPTNVSICSSILYNTSVAVCTVIGFPHGRSSITAKAAEINAVAEQGAGEVDIVLNYQALRAGEKSLATEDAVRLCEAAKAHNLRTKIIVETCYLNQAQKLDALLICEQAGADFIKTSTGFGSAGAQVDDIRLFADRRQNGIQIKASGGIRNLASSLEMIHAGATRLGVSAAGNIMKEAMGEQVDPVDRSNY